MAAADHIADEHGLNRQWVRRAIGGAHWLPDVVRFMSPSQVSVSRNWGQYKTRIVDPVRINGGVKFWGKHRAALERAKTRYGVPPNIIVGILGVETLYGQQMGNYKAIDALATLAFDFPANHPKAAARSAFFKSELGYLLSLKKLSGIDPLTVRGSFAGALGMPQFMPSSWARHAVDFDGDGRIDLFKSPADAIGSIANYFKNYNWRPGMPTHYPVRFDPEMIELDALLAPDILPTFPVDTFRFKGALLEGESRQHPGPLALVELKNGEDEPSYIAGTENFYVVTRYNWSSYYAMAVIELGQAVEKIIK